MSRIQATPRIQAAKSLLRSGEHSVKETAFLSGFHSVGYFCRVFRSRTGRTPLNFALEKEA